MCMLLVSDSEAVLHAVYGVWGANIENPNDRVIDIGQFGGGAGTSS